MPPSLARFLTGIAEWELDDERHADDAIDLTKDTSVHEVLVIQDRHACVREFLRCLRFERLDAANCCPDVHCPSNFPDFTSDTALSMSLPM